MRNSRAFCSVLSGIMSKSSCTGLYHRRIRTQMAWKEAGLYHIEDSSFSLSFAFVKFLLHIFSEIARPLPPSWAKARSGLSLWLLSGKVLMSKGSFYDTHNLILAIISSKRVGLRKRMNWLGHHCMEISSYYLISFSFEHKTGSRKLPNSRHLTHWNHGTGLGQGLEDFFHFVNDQWSLGTWELMI